MFFGGSKVVSKCQDRMFLLYEEGPQECQDKCWIGKVRL